MKNLAPSIFFLSLNHWTQSFWIRTQATIRLYWEFVVRLKCLVRAPKTACETQWRIKNQSIKCSTAITNITRSFINRRFELNLAARRKYEEKNIFKFLLHDTYRESTKSNIFMYKIVCIFIFNELKSNWVNCVIFFVLFAYPNCIVICRRNNLLSYCINWLVPYFL